MRRRAPHDWTSVREWTNLFVAVGALLVAVVSVWTTAQISGVEDYFRSEIARRNSDLNSLADQARRVGSVADERETRLARLQTTTDEVIASNLNAQGKLLSTEQELSRVGIAVVSARQTLASSEARLASLSAQSQKQVSLIDLFRRQRFFERAQSRFGYEVIRYSQQHRYASLDGESAYNLITNWSVGNLDPELASYLPDFISNARNTCQSLRSFKPRIPALLPLPEDVPSPRDKAAVDEWKARWNASAESETRAADAASKARLYLSHAAGSCMCRALATTEHSPEAICSSYATSPAQPTP